MLEMSASTRTKISDVDELKTTHQKRVSTPESRCSLNVLLTLEVSLEVDISSI